MTSLPDHDALLDGIAKAQRSKKSSKSPHPAYTPPRIDLRQQRYPVLPTITSNSNRCSDQGIKKDSEREAATHQCSTPLPAILPEPAHNIPVGANVNLMPGGIPVLPMLLPWQHAHVSHANLFDAHHNTAHNVNNRKVTKKEPWFKKFKYRPMSEDRAAVIIQRHCRGYLTRRNLEFQQYMANRWLANRLVDKIIDETLQNDVIPDVLIELLQERMSCGGWFVSDPEHQAQRLVCSRLINEVVAELLPVYVKESNHEMVIGYLHEHGIHREPLVHVVKSLMDDVIDELVRDEVEAYISDTLRSYFAESQSAHLTDTLLEDTVDKDYLSELAVEVLMEYIYDTLHGEVVDHELLVVVRECLMEEWSSGDWSAASGLVLPVADEMMLSVLLSHVADHGSELNMQYYADSVMSEIMLRVCLQQMMGIHERQVATEDNVMLRQLHQQIFQEMAFDMLLETWTDLWH